MHSADPLLLPQLMETGAEFVDLPGADHVFSRNLRSLDGLAGLSVGSDLYPDDGATLVVRGTIGDRPRLRISGSGIDSDAALTLGGGCRAGSGGSARRSRATRWGSSSSRSTARGWSA